MDSYHRGARLALTLALIAAAACSGSSSPTPLPTPAATPTPAVPTPSPSAPPVAAACPIGKGTVDTSCARHSPVFLEEVEAAVDLLARQSPDVFNLSDVDAAGAWRVVKVEDYYAGVVANLQAAGFCAQFDGAFVQVKKSNDLSEDYDILVSTGHVRRGAGAYRQSCAPANFPLDPEDVIDSIRVAFYGFRCPDARTPPNNGLGLLPLDCTGFVTATPKNKDNKDVPASVHGPQIDWVLRSGADVVRVHDVPTQAFNKDLVGLRKDHFTLCAIVKGVEGCLYGEVID